MGASWKVNIFKADANKVYQEIGDDQITPEQVLEKAKDENTELHKCFEWDDTKAAEKYRLHQARQIIQYLVYTPETIEHTPQRIYQITTQKGVYQPTKLFLEQPDEYQALLERAKGELVAIRRRYESLAELEAVFEAIDEL